MHAPADDVSRVVAHPRMLPCLRQPQEHVDYLPLQALLFERNTGLNLYQQTRLLYAFQRRVAD